MAAPTDTDPPSRATIREAANWHAQLADESCTDEDRAECARWLEADPSHRRAFEQMSLIADRFADQPAIERTALKRMMGQRASRSGAVALLMVCTVSTLGWWASVNPDVRTRFADERTAIGEQRSISLASGDSITLDSDTAADTNDGGRSIRLWQGAVMADVRQKRAQPFVVRTGQGTARAMGTRYSVSTAGDATVVTVIASRVEACATQGNRRCTILEPGHSARMDAVGLTRLPDVDPFEAGSWVQGILYANDRPLAAVLAELNRYRVDPIRYDAAALSGINVSGSFPLKDARRALASMSRILPITVRHTGEEIIVSRR